MTTETLSTLARSIALLLTCLNMFAAGAAAFLYFKGDNQAKATDSKPGDGNGMKTAATVILVCVFVLNMFGFLGYGVSFALPSSTAAEPTQTAPDQSQPDQQQSDSPTVVQPLCQATPPAGMTFTAPVSGIRLENNQMLNIGEAAYFRVINWSKDCTSAEVYLYYSTETTSYILAGSSSSSPNIDTQIWSYTGTDFGPMPKDTCELARDTLKGALGADVSVVVHYGDQKGGYLNNVPEACMP